MPGGDRERMIVRVPHGHRRRRDAGRTRAAKEIGMNGIRFDTLARSLSTIVSRRETVKAAAVASMGLGLAGLGLDAAAAKGKRKKRCKKLGQGCKPGGKRKCCKKQNLVCGEARDDLGGNRCCKGFGTECGNAEECCGDLACIADPVLGGPAKCRSLLT
jgi:hypothetical protein